MEPMRVTIVNTEDGQVVRFITRHGMAERPFGSRDRAHLDAGLPISDLDPVGAVLASLTGQA